MTGLTEDDVRRIIREELAESPFQAFLNGILADYAEHGGSKNDLLRTITHATLALDPELGEHRRKVTLIVGDDRFTGHVKVGSGVLPDEERPRAGVVSTHPEGDAASLTITSDARDQSVQVGGEVVVEFAEFGAVDGDDGHGSPSVDASGPESRDASSPTVGAASGVHSSGAPDAPSGGAGDETDARASVVGCGFVELLKRDRCSDCPQPNLGHVADGRAELGNVTVLCSPAKRTQELVLRLVVDGAHVTSAEEDTPSHEDSSRSGSGAATPDVAPSVEDGADTGVSSHLGRVGPTFGAPDTNGGAA